MTMHFWRLRNLPPYITPILLFSSTNFLIKVGEGIMSYVVPVYIESRVNNPLFMGLAISLSSLVCLLCDLFIPKLFSGMRYLFFLIAGVIISIIFPISLIMLPTTLLFTTISMVIWGIYFELILFAGNKFVETTSPRNQYVLSWSIIQSLQSAAYLVSPIIAISLLNTSPVHAFSGAVVFFASSLVGIFLLWKNKGNHSVILNLPEKQTIRQVLSVWKLLIGKVWPLHLFLCIINIVDSFFWTIGVLLSESLRQNNFIGSLFIPAFAIPELFSGFIAVKITPKLGKKHTAFISGIFMGLCLIGVGLVTKTELIVLFVLCSSVFASIALPSLNSTFEDYISRLNHTSEDMMGLQYTAGSIAYIVGPITAGAIASIVGIQPTFAVLGGVLAVLSVIMLIVVPRKIRMPQAALSEIPQ